MALDFEWLEDEIFKRCMTAAERESLRDVMQEHIVAQGDSIMRQGEPGGCLLFIRSGKADICQLTGDGKEAHIAAVGVGGLLGEMSFLTGEPASASVIAITDCTCYFLTNESFIELMLKQQSLVFAIMAYMLSYSATIVRNMNNTHMSMLQYIGGSKY
ncbi:MAG: cyclic nucleotide-binding domain-containing protein [Mariprofundales bacterium]